MLIAVDQLSKHIILTVRDVLPLSVIDNVFALTFAWNRGVSFSFFSGTETPLNIFGLTIPADAYLPVLLTLVALIAVVIFIRWIPQEEALGSRLAIGAIIGGALGNALDRLQHGAVVDFILFYWPPYYFPAFNIADSAITCGVLLLIGTHLRHTFLQNKNENRNEAKIDE